MPNNRQMRFRWAGWLAIAVWLITSCSTPAPTNLNPTSSPTGSETELSSTVTPIPTSLPTETPAPGRVILLAPDGSQPALQNLFDELTQAENLSFTVQPSLDLAEIGPEVRLVIATSPDPGISNLAAAAPGTQFLAVGIPGLEPAANLSLIESTSQHPDRLGFLGGYLAAAITEHWRVGMLGVSDSPGIEAAQQGFKNGVVFFCGLCRPAYPPYVQYPVSVSVPAASSITEQQAAVDNLAAQYVNTVFVMGELINPELVAYLASKEMRVISDAFPSPENSPNWVATISRDVLPGIQQIWPSLLGGEGGKLIETGLILEDVNPAWLSPGRQQYVEEIITEINEGIIDTGADRN